MDLSLSRHIPRDQQCLSTYDQQVFLVTDVVSNTPAEIASIRAGDVVERIGDADASAVIQVGVVSKS